MRPPADGLISENAGGWPAQGDHRKPSRKNQPAVREARPPAPRDPILQSRVRTEVIRFLCRATARWLIGPPNRWKNPPSPPRSRFVRATQAVAKSCPPGLRGAESVRKPSLRK